MLRTISGVGGSVGGLLDPNGLRFPAVVADPLKGTATLTRLVAPHQSFALLLILQLKTTGRQKKSYISIF